jgi:hypothetical protein
MLANMLFPQYILAFSSRLTIIINVPPNDDKPHIARADPSLKNFTTPHFLISKHLSVMPPTPVTQDMPSPPANAPDKCCDRYSPRRTCQQFLRNHVKQNVPVAKGDDCRICWNDYGAMDVAQGVLEIACQIVGIAGCNHTFGLACIKQIMYSGTMLCPLCSTAWFVNSFADEYGNGAETDDDTARYRSYSEPEYYPRMPSLRLRE